RISSRKQGRNAGPGPPAPFFVQYWIIQTLNSLALGGLLFLLAAGFSLIFGLMRIANLTHGSLYMLGAYVGVTILKFVPNLWLAALIGGAVIAIFGGLIERFILRALAGNALGQVLVTLGISFIVADFCLIVWGGDPIPVQTPLALQQPLRIGGVAFPTYRLVVLAVAVVAAVALYLALERTRIGAMIRAGVDDMQMARIVGIPVSRLFTLVFCLGAGLAGAGGVIGGPILAAYPGLVPNDFYVNLASQILIYAVWALSLNLLVGAGMQSLGHAVYLGSGAYVCAWLVANAGLGHASAALATVGIVAVMAGLFGVLA